MAAETNTKARTYAKGGSLKFETASKPNDIGSSEVLVRLKAIAINPADFKMIDEGHRVTSWPFVSGLDGAGIVEAVGDKVTGFAPGDEVAAMFSPTDRSGAYQNFAVVPEGYVAIKPPSWSFEEVATLGVCFLTATIALGVGLRTALPYLIGGPSSGFRLSSVLILGGSSALGAATIQLLRISVPDCKILVTSSPKHHDHLVKTLGADAAIDRSSKSLVEDVRTALGGQNGVDAIVDAVGAARLQSEVFDALDINGPKRYASVWTGEEEIKAPDGVDGLEFRGASIATLQGGKNLMPSLQNLLQEGKYKLPVPVRKVGDEIAALTQALDIMRKGVSGEKLVVTV